MEKSFSEPDEIVELSYLYDFYGALLKENHRQVFEDYVLNNLSLGEIAGERQITRQGVYDIVRRCRIRLKEYEDKLRLVSKFQLTKKKLQEIERIAREGAEGEVSEQITRLAEEIYDVI
ncbi:MAG: DNA-binding protein [Eubacterium sp.]|nr:DNA-binding protein [Eubacterium sp.]